MRRVSQRNLHWLNNLSKLNEILEQFKTLWNKNFEHFHSKPLNNSTLFCVEKLTPKNRRRYLILDKKKENTLIADSPVM